MTISPQAVELSMLPDAPIPPSSRVAAGLFDSPR